MAQYTHGAWISLWKRRAEEQGLDASDYKYVRLAHEINYRTKWSKDRCTARDLIQIKAAQNGKCTYCGENFDDTMCVDHIVTVLNGGTSAPSNLQWLHLSCNGRKGAFEDQGRVRPRTIEGTKGSLRVPDRGGT